MFSGREFSDISNRNYYAYITKNKIADTVEGRTLFNAGFYRGAQYAMKTSGELSPHIARFVQFVMWIVELDSSDRS